MIDSSTNNNFNWEVFLYELGSCIDKESFETWIKPLGFIKNEGSVLYITAPSKFIKDYVLKSYKNTIINALNLNYPTIKDIDVAVSTFSDNPIEINDSLEINEMDQRIEKAFSNTLTNSKFSSSNLEIPLNENYTFENFVVGKPNEFAYNAAMRVAKDPNIQFNPLFLYGGVGLGKTHLMHSIAWEVSKNSERKFLYLTAEKFASLFIMSLRDRDIFSFKEIFRSTDVLMIDDFQFISGKEQTQEEFFHTFNSLISQGKQIILSADKAPSQLDRIEERMISRLNAGLSIDIHATTYELRVGILESKARIIGVKIPSDVVDFLAHTITSNVRELEGALKRVISYHQLMGVTIDLNMAMHVLEDLLKHKNKIINIEVIQKKVSEHYNIKLVDMSSSKKDKTTATTRQIAMYIAKRLTSSSLPEIGRKFGGRDHTTVMYAVKKISELMTKDSNLENEINLLIKIIQQS